MDPRIAMLLQTSLVNYRHELLIENFAGIPIAQQHGAQDDNVPVYHSRNMQHLISQSGWDPKYIELPGKGHWFEGVMTTEPLRIFYQRFLKSSGRLAELPHKFTLIVPGTGGIGSRGGIAVDQVCSPDQLGRVEVIQHTAPSTWILKTSNILRFHFTSDEWDGPRPDFVVIDSSDTIRVEAVDGSSVQYFFRRQDHSWMVTTYLLVSCMKLT